MDGMQAVVVVPDLANADAQLVERGVADSEIPSVDGDVNRVREVWTALDNVGFVFFRDADGDRWRAVQPMSRLV